MGNRLDFRTEACLDGALREPAGIVWTEIQHRLYARIVQSDMPEDLVPLLTLLGGLEREFPHAVEFERELWGDAISLAIAGRTGNQGHPTVDGVSSAPGPSDHAAHAPEGKDDVTNG